MADLFMNPGTGINGLLVKYYKENGYLTLLKIKKYIVCTVHCLPEIISQTGQDMGFLTGTKAPLV